MVSRRVVQWRERPVRSHEPVRRARPAVRIFAALGVGLLWTGVTWPAAYAAPRPIEGTPNRTGAPLVREGDYRDSLGPAETGTGQRHYRLERDEPTERWRVSVALDVGRTPDGFRLSTVTETGEQCASDTATSVGNAGPVTSTVNPFGGDCGTETVVYLVVERRSLSTAADHAEQGLLLRVAEVPEARNNEELPTALPTVRTTTLQGPSEPELVAGGTLAEPLPMEPGTVAADLEPGRPLYFAVPVDWGQSLQLTVALPAGQSASVRVLNPALSEVCVDSGSGPLNVTCPPVLYRASGTDRAGRSTLAGDYVISVALDEDAQPGRAQLTVAVSGEVQGVPDLPRRHLIRDDTTRVAGGVGLIALGAGALTAAAIGAARQRRR